MISTKSEAIASVCAALREGSIERAKSVLGDRYPFVPLTLTNRSYGALEATRVFLRDGFIDRYSGIRLIYPPVLRLLSAMLPEQFPFHPNWKVAVTHPAYWEVSATVDHLVPVSRGGLDAEENWVTTSMVRNAAKANWLLEELGWTLQAPGSRDDWDGMLQWFKAITSERPDLVQATRLGSWVRVTLRATA